MPKRHFPGDDRRSAWDRGPEIIAAEQRILTLADALVSWMRQVPLSDRDYSRMDSFFTHKNETNPGLTKFDHTSPDGEASKRWFLETFDRDANTFMIGLLRAAWERRCWRARYGEITEREQFQ